MNIKIESKFKTFIPNNAEVQLTNNQFKDGVWQEPDVELKTFIIHCNEDQFLDLYLQQIGMPPRYFKFYKFLLKHIDNGGGFSLPALGTKLIESGFNTFSCQTLISELRLFSYGGIPLVKKLNNGMWRIPKEFLYLSKGFEDCEFKVYVIKK